MKAKTNLVSTDTISTIFNMVNNSKQIGFNMESFKQSSGLVKAVMVILLAMVGGGVAWFFMFHQIAPLMLIIAITIPILCIGIAQQNKSILRIIKEWSEYKYAVDELVKLVSLGTFPPDISEKICTAIQLVQDEADDVDEVLVEIGDTAKELLEAAKDAVDSSTDGIVANTSTSVKPNIIPRDETEDLSIKI